MRRGIGSGGKSWSSMIGSCGFSIGIIIPERMIWPCRTDGGHSRSPRHSARTRGLIRAQIRPGHVFGFKDPRTARLLPLWTPIFRALNLDPRFIFCVRSPTQVARSLEDRDGLPLQTGEYRWAVYNTECWRNLRAEACTIVYDSWFESRDETLGRLVAFLSDVIDVDLRTVAQAVDAQIDRTCVMTDRVPRESGNRNALLLWSSSSENHDDETRLAINRFVDQFAAFQQIIPSKAQ